MAKVKVKNQKALNSAKNKLRGSVSIGRTKYGVVAKKWPKKKTKKVLYKSQKEKVRSKLSKNQGVKDSAIGSLLGTKKSITEINGITNVNYKESYFEKDKILSHIKKQPYFTDGNFVLYQGDSIELLNDLPENSIDMIFADPPYNLSNGGFTCHAGRKVSVNKGNWDVSNGLKKDFEFHKNWTKACHRVLKPHGTIWISGTYHSIYKCGFALQIGGFHILNEISWFKPNASPNLSCRFFTASHETLIWARKDKKAKHKFNYGVMKNGIWPGDFIKKPGLQMRSVWAISPPQNGEKKFGKHPTQKPLELLKRIILASTDKNDIILDPFTGSSTTGLAAIMHGRKFVGIDKEKEYLDLSIKRFKDTTNNLI